MSAIGYIRHELLKGYSSEFCMGYMSHTRNKLTHMECDYVKDYILWLYFILNNFLITKPS
jgi:hypothetical protein